MHVCSHVHVCVVHVKIIHYLLCTAAGVLCLHSFVIKFSGLLHGSKQKITPSAVKNIINNIKEKLAHTKTTVYNNMHAIITTLLTCTDIINKYELHTKLL